MHDNLLVKTAGMKVQNRKKKKKTFMFTEI